MKAHCWVGQQFINNIGHSILIVSLSTRERLVQDTVAEEQTGYVRYRLLWMSRRASFDFPGMAISHEPWTTVSIPRLGPDIQLQVASVDFAAVYKTLLDKTRSNTFLNGFCRVLALWEPERSLVAEAMKPMRARVTKRYDKWYGTYRKSLEQASEKVFG